MSLHAQLTAVLHDLTNRLDLMDVADYEDTITERITPDNAPSGELTQTLTIRWRRRG